MMTNPKYTYVSRRCSAVIKIKQEKTGIDIVNLFKDFIRHFLGKVMYIDSFNPIF